MHTILHTRFLNIIIKHVNLIMVPLVPSIEIEASGFTADASVVLYIDSLVLNLGNSVAQTKTATDENQTVLLCFDPTA
jgi:hypothetical protein